MLIDFVLGIMFLNVEFVYFHKHAAHRITMYKQQLFQSIALRKKEMTTWLGNVKSFTSDFEYFYINGNQ